jgi:hypothetical protein
MRKGRSYTLTTHILHVRHILVVAVAAVLLENDVPGSSHVSAAAAAHGRPAKLGDHIVVELPALEVEREPGPDAVEPEGADLLEQRAPGLEQRRRALEALVRLVDSLITERQRALNGTPRGRVLHLLNFLQVVRLPDDLRRDLPEARTREEVLRVRERD